jgi:4,5-dihydroxyphthalate decarboxylase
MSSRLELSVCFWNYDRTMPMVDGRVAIERCEPSFTLLGPEQAFARAFTTAEFDVSELSLSNHMSALVRGDAAYVPIPVFPSRSFRHSAFYVRSDRAITEPRDLVGKRIGLQEYQMTAAVVLRGFLRDEYGIVPGDMSWRVADIDPAHPSAIAVPDIPGVEIERVHGRSLDALLGGGDVDAVIALRPPPSFLAGDGRVVRLFPDWRNAEQDYYARTGFFPIMHTVGIKHALVAAHPWLPSALYRAFCLAKDVAIAELENLQAPKATLPWAAAELAATRSVMGHDFWPYGLEPNRAAIERMIRYHHEEGLSPRPFSIQELFPLEVSDK